MPGVAGVHLVEASKTLYGVARQGLLKRSESKLVRA
jgi:hypothetical protein